jgi:hypothetical protein
VEREKGNKGRGKETEKEALEVEREGLERLVWVDGEASVDR